MNQEPASPLTKRWLISEHNDIISAEASEGLKDYPPLIRQLLYNRGITTLEQAAFFLTQRYPGETDPFLMKDMKKAVDRLRQAVQTQELIAVYGDYDVDGVTATALMVEFLRAAGARVIPYIPDRVSEGYGVNKEALQKLFDQGARLVVTVDCGIRSPREAVFARKLGLDLIISDHHLPEGKLPKAKAVINPKQAGDGYPYKDLAGVGLAYKIAQAYLQPYPVDGVQVDDWLDLVALGTVADMAPLGGENRALVASGLGRIRQGRRQGLSSLAGAAGQSIEKTTAGDVGFILGPRLNAAGRLESALAAYDLLTTQDPSQASTLAQKLDVQNVDRQHITREIQEKAVELAQQADPDSRLIFAFDEQFNVGVVGLAASRLVETYYRPAIVGRIDKKETRASCRSIPEFNITEALDQCRELMVHHGGHAAAAGFTIKNKNLAELKKRLEGIAREKLSGLELRPVLRADAEISLTREMLAHLPDWLAYFNQFQPFGMGNPEIHFVTRNFKVAGKRLVGRDSNHLKLTLTNEEGVIFDAIAFRQGHWFERLPERIDLLYTLEMNEFNGRRSMQLNVRDIHPAGAD